MQVSVRLSAALAQVTGAARVQVSVQEEATVADVFDALTAAYPPLAPRLQHAVAIVAGAHATRQAAVQPGQEVAFLMPVAGGQCHGPVAPVCLLSTQLVSILSRRG